MNKSEVIYKLALAYKRYDNCNPDVGMGWADEHYVDAALNEMEWNKKDISYDEVVTKMKKDG